MCENLDDGLTLHSGCMLVKVNLSNKLRNRLQREMKNETTMSGSESNTLLSDTLNEQNVGDGDNESESGDLTMDLLPDSCRFTTMVHVPTYTDLFYNDDDDDDDDENDGDGGEDDEEDEEDEEREVDEKSEEEREAENRKPAKLQQQVSPMIMYIQRNSRFRLVLLSDDFSDYKSKFDLSNARTTVRIL